MSIKSSVSMIVLIILAVFILLTAGIYSYQYKMIFFPELLPQNFQFQFDHQFDELNYKTPDGYSINALHFKVHNPKGVVFYNHGNAGSLRTWGSVAETFLNNKYNLLIYDYRGFGKSEGKISEEKLYKDAEMIYNSLLDLYSEDSIIVYGRSIGTGIATKIATECKPKQLILESPYYNLPDLIKKIFPIIPARIIRFKFPNNERMQHIQSPIIIFHGTLDEVVYFGSSLKLEKLMKEKDQLIPIEGGHHNDLAEFDDYHKELALILK